MATPPRPSTPPALAGPAPEAPIIDAVLVEKPSVCEDEENLITVKAHTREGRDDAYLHYFIGYGTGQSFPLQ
ncbi:MAG TPA: hypothetical protein VFB50_04580, partial [Chloroflexota bacterium]|nr:hypothetical protein [Chloroflexota bacterium]